VKKTFLTMGLILAAGFLTPAFAQDAAAGANANTSVVAQWSIITAGFALAIPLLYLQERVAARWGIEPARDLVRG